MANHQVLIIAEDADKYAGYLEGKSAPSIPFIACHTAREARAAYSGQSILLGEPNLIAEVIDAMPSVQWVQSIWAGVKPLVDKGRSDYVLTGIKAVFGPKMSEYALGYMLAHELKILQRAEYQRRAQWGDVTSGSLQGKKVGIMGTGSIGRHLAGVLRSFGTHITGLNRSGNPANGFERILPVGEIIQFVEELDYLISILPDTPATDHLLNGDVFKALPEHAVLINIGRGNVVDNTALITALENKQLAGAVLDVFDEEPLAAESPLWKAPNILITAHVAADSHATEITPLFVENYRRFTSHQALNYVVDFTKGY